MYKLPKTAKATPAENCTIVSLLFSQHDSSEVVTMVFVSKQLVKSVLK